jgi:hypothetical protein
MILGTSSEAVGGATQTDRGQAHPTHQRTVHLIEIARLIRTYQSAQRARISPPPTLEVGMLAGERRRLLRAPYIVGTSAYISDLYILKDAGHSYY